MGKHLNDEVFPALRPTAKCEPKVFNVNLISGKKKFSWKTDCLFFSLFSLSLNIQMIIFVHIKVLVTEQLLNLTGIICEQILADTSIYVKSKSPRLKSTPLKGSFPTGK